MLGVKDTLLKLTYHQDLKIKNLIKLLMIKIKKILIKSMTDTQQYCFT